MTKYNAVYDTALGEYVLVEYTPSEYAEAAKIDAATHNTGIKRALASNDLKAIRALLENDTARIEQYRAEQEQLRLQLVPE